ncbi:VOC family protein [Mesobacillus jeotgali]|uniref:VOC family protein n=1 Tax=Mesobacillus jeotgali TaxID=129985 RepID=UPI0009A655D8|nr:VOC family protein [Mesobacillus jeotgali]
MTNRLIRVGTIYLPVKDPLSSSEWYIESLGARLNYLDQDKAILDLADISLFLVKSSGQSANFKDINGAERFTVTYEVDGLEALQLMHADFIEQGMKVGEIENRGHAGRNFVFYDPDGNKFDVWSELSSKYKQRMGMEEQ